jgi:hypothetical protein
MKHLIPDYSDLSQYSIDYDGFISKLSKKMDLESYGNRFSPYLLVAPKSIQSQVKNVHAVLTKAVSKIVESYLSDDSLQQALSLDDRQLSLITLASKKPYKTFSIRPDFLISQDNEVKVCEINARFTINGFMAAFYLHQQMSEYFPNHSGMEDTLSNIIDSYMSNFDTSKPIFLLREKETGYDLNLLKLFLLERGITVIDIKPHDLHMLDGKIVAKNTVCDQLILELHQFELEKIPSDILENIILGVNYVNDIRTILIAHDKRLFSILSDMDIMSRYLSDEEVAILGKHVIKTYSLKQVKDDVLNNKGAWVLKKCLSGKGEGMHVGAESSLDEIASVINEQEAQYIAQPFLDQKKVGFFMDGEYKYCNSVGMIISINNKYQGVGFFRLSPSSIVAVSRGGGILVPSFR